MQYLDDAHNCLEKLPPDETRVAYALHAVNSFTTKTKGS